jgi:hypothetical protein
MLAAFLVVGALAVLSVDVESRRRALD